jgi:Xaa-Pro aminopeptidase
MSSNAIPCQLTTTCHAQAEGLLDEGLPMISLFTREEMVARLAKLQAHMVKSGIELAIFDEMEAMFWLSGYANSENRWRACLVPAAGEPFFVIRALCESVPDCLTS